VSQKEFAMSLGRSILVAFIAAFAPRALAQCTDWRGGFNLPGSEDTISASVVFDDGTGPALYVAGSFHIMNGQPARCLAKWDGVSWSEVGGGIGLGDVQPGLSGLGVFDDGTGSKLYVAGAFSDAGGTPATNIAAWDGTQWSTLGAGLNGLAEAFCVFDDGSGPALFMGGDFNFTGTTPLFHIAKWNGQAILPAAVNGANQAITTFAVHDDGTGPKLYAGGNFTYLDGPVQKVAVLNGGTWSALPGTINGIVWSLCSFDDGSGPALYAAGEMTFPPAASHGIIRFDGTQWNPVANGGLWATTGGAQIRALQVFDDGTGPKLYAGGSFNIAAATVHVNNIAAWDGTTWSTVGAGVFGSPQHFCVFDDGLGGGAQLVATGNFRKVGDTAASMIAAWRTSWHGLGDGAGLDERIQALTYDDTLGGGPALYAAGSFTAAGGATGVSGVGRFDGVSWSSLHADMDGPASLLQVFDDGSGKKLYVTGFFQHINGVDMHGIARWDGTWWSPANNGLASALWLKVFDVGSGSALYAGTNGEIMKWTGSAWVPAGWPNFQADYAIEFDDGNGPKVYATGTATVLGGQLQRRVGRLDGTTWTLLGFPFDQPPQRLCVAPVAGTPRLIALGRYFSEGALPLPAVASWDGTAWSALGGGLTFPGQGVANVFATMMWDDHTGGGSQLYVAGHFSMADGMPANNIARWDGNAWSPVGGGTDNYVYALQSLPTANGSDLYAGGLFKHAGSLQSSYMARFSNECSSETGRTYCFGDGSGTACPCGNSSAPVDREGCLNSLGLGGRMRGAGTASVSADSLVLTSTGVPNGSGLYFQGTTAIGGGAGAVFGDGLRCAGGTVLRLGTVQASANSSHYPGTGNVGIALKGAVARYSYATRRYQYWYRNAGAAFCTPSTFNLTNGVEITWIP
jgi:hypothetical protein